MCKPRSRPAREKVQTCLNSSIGLEGIIVPYLFVSPILNTIACHPCLNTQLFPAALSIRTIMDFVRLPNSSYMLTRLPNSSTMNTTIIRFHPFLHQTSLCEITKKNFFDQVSWTTQLTHIYFITRISLDTSLVNLKQIIVGFTQLLLKWDLRAQQSHS